MKLRCLITGTGRSGTVFVARLLSGLGLPCGHESVFDWHGLPAAVRRLAGEEPCQLSHASQIRYENGQYKPIPKWLPDHVSVEAESSYLAAPFLGEEAVRGVPVIHVVRDPVKVVNSFCNFINYFQKDTPSNKYEELVYSVLPELREPMPAYDRCCLFWIRWNRMVEEAKPALFYRIEDGPEKIMGFLGLEGEPFSDDTVNSFRKDGGCFVTGAVKDDKIRREFTDMGRRYGYSMASEHLLL